MTERNSSTRSIERAFDILECFLHQNQELPMMEITNQTGLSPSTVHRLIAALEKRQYLERNSDNKKYHLGLKIAQLGSISLSNMKKDFRKIALPHIFQLRDTFNESVSLYVVDGKSRVCVERAESTHPLRRVVNIGQRFKLGKGATGRLLLAFLPENQAKQIIEEYDDHIEIEMQKVRNKGYAVSIGEREEGVTAIAAPIFNENGKVVAALSMSGPSARFPEYEMQEKIEAVIKNATEISVALGYINLND